METEMLDATKALRYTPAQTSLARTLRQRSEGFDAARLANLLTPHRVVQPLLIDQLVVPTRFDDAAALEDVDAVRVQDRRQPMGDEHGNRVAARRHVADRLDDP